MGMKDLINKPHFTTGGGGDLPPDPAIPTRIRVCLDNVVAYAGNPRQSRNPAFDELKDSIRAIGLQNPPNVTRANPADPYMIRDGGNTRLEILRELWSETGDRKFYEFDCMFHPYTDDLDILIKHVVENEVRGGMILVERGLAALRAKRYFEARDAKPISNVALARELKQLGWAIHDKSLGTALFAADSLLEILPRALWSGMGRAPVENLRRIAEDCRKFWVRLPEHADDPEEAEAEFEIIWAESLAAQDHEDFSVDAAQNALEAAIAEYINCPASSVRGEIQAMSRGLSQGGVKPVSVLDQPGANPKPGEPIKPKLEPETKASAPEPKSPKPKQTTQELAAAKTPNPGRSGGFVEPQQELQPQQETHDQFAGGQFSGADDQWQTEVVGNDLNQPSSVPSSNYADWPLVDMQRRCYELVRGYFEELGIPHYVMDTSVMGYGGHLGFCIAEPSDELKSFMDDKPTLRAIYQQFALLGASSTSQLTTPGIDIGWLVHWGGSHGGLLRSLDMQGVRNYTYPGSLEAQALEVMHTVEIIAKAIAEAVNNQFNPAYVQGA